MTKTVQVPRECCAAKCRKVATHAHKLSDFWVSTCDDHVGATVSINKALDTLALDGQTRVFTAPPHSNRSIVPRPSAAADDALGTPQSVIDKRPHALNCGTCLMEHAEVVPLRNDETCPCCERNHEKGAA